MKKYVVGICSMFDNEVKLFKVEAINEYGAVKKGMLESCTDEESKNHELTFQDSEDYPADLEGLQTIYEEIPFSVIEI